MKPPRSTQSDAGAANTHTGVFPATIWAELDRLKGANSTMRQDLYDFLIRRYWKPVYSFLLCKGYGEQKTEDLVMDFFAFCFQGNVFSKANPDRGRFRSFLLKSLQHFVANEQRRAGAKKRNPPGGLVSIHDLATNEGWPVQLADKKTPEDAFDRTWWRELFLRAVETLKLEYQASKMNAHYDILLARIVRPALEGSERVSYRELAKRHNLTEKESQNRCITARKALLRLLKEEIRVYASSEDEAAAEIRDIFHFLSET